LSFAGNVGSIKLRFNRRVTVFVKQSPLYADITLSRFSETSNLYLLLILKYGLGLFNSDVHQPFSLSIVIFTVYIVDGINFLFVPMIGEYIPLTSASSFCSS